MSTRSRDDLFIIKPTQALDSAIKHLARSQHRQHIQVDLLLLLFTLDSIMRTQALKSFRNLPNAQQPFCPSSCKMSISSRTNRNAIDASTVIIRRDLGSLDIAVELNCMHCQHFSHSSRNTKISVFDGTWHHYYTLQWVAVHLELS